VRRLGSILSVALACGLLLAGCGEAPADNVAVTDSDGFGANAGVPQPDCSDEAADEVDDAVPLSDDVQVTAIVRCVGSFESVPGQGEWSVITREQVTGPQMDALLTALLLPSEPRTSGFCTLELPFPVTIGVQTTAGPAAIAPPTDPCGKTRSEVIEAYQALPWVEVSRARVQQERPEAAVKAGCEQWKDMLAISATDARSGGPGPVLPPGTEDATLHVCVYRAVYPHGWTQSANTLVDGAPIGGGTLTAPDGDRLRTLLDAAGPATACAKQHSQFAVVTANGAATRVDPLYVELDGCLRLLAPDGSLRQADAELAALLTNT
jgi:hypothetical protein